MRRLCEDLYLLICQWHYCSNGENGPLCYCVTVTSLFWWNNLRFSQSHWNKRQVTSEVSLLYLLIWISIIFTGDAIQPTAGSNRFMISCWWIFCVIITATYSANLIAFLSVEIYYPPFNNLQELYNQDEYKFGTTFRAFFKVSFFATHIVTHFSVKRYRFLYLILRGMLAERVFFNVATIGNMRGSK